MAFLLTCFLLAPAPAELALASRLSSASLVRLEFGENLLFTSKINLVRKPARMKDHTMKLRFLYSAV